MDIQVLGLPASDTDLEVARLSNTGSRRPEAALEHVFERHIDTARNVWCRHYNRCLQDANKALQYVKEMESWRCSPGCPFRHEIDLGGIKRVATEVLTSVKSKAQARNDLAPGRNDRQKKR